MKRSFLIVCIFITVSCGLYSNGSVRLNIFTQDTINYVSQFAEANESCFKCHSLRKYEYTDEATGQQERGLMLPWMIILRQQFYESNHKSFKCTECHSHDFEIYPHPEEIKSEYHFHCLDCHGGDPAYAAFKFEEIDAEYSKSVHFSLEEKGFTCWNCHDPHVNKLMARNSKNFEEIIAYDNNICLDCHADNYEFSSFSDSIRVNLRKSHKWLPNQTIHLKAVRCIDCHNTISEKVLVSHLIVPGGEAVRDCNKCHSDKATAMTSLLAIWSRDDDSKEFNNDSVLDALSIIGPGRNRMISWLSTILFASVILIIGIHLLFRIIKR